MARGADRANSPRALQREASRAALLRAAHQVAEAGGDPLDPAAVATVAGVSRPLWYRYFPSRMAFVEALLATLHAPPPPGRAPGDPVADLLAFFGALAGGLDEHAALAKVLIPASHLPGDVAQARSRRREAAIARVSDLLAADLPQRARIAAFLMDTFLGMQLAWCKGQVVGRLADRVAADLPWAIAGALGARVSAATDSAAPPSRRSDA